MEDRKNKMHHTENKTLHEEKDKNDYLKIGGDEAWNLLLITLYKCAITEVYKDINVSYTSENNPDLNIET